MRSSRSSPDPLDPGRNGFAHRGLHRAPGIVENTLVSFAASLEAGAGIECDLRLTADNQILVFHDADAVRLCGSPDVIGQSTVAQLAHLKLGVFVNSTGTFTDQPKVANGASELMQDVFGEAGRHARSAVGVPVLPLGVAVEVDAVVQIKS